MRLLTYLVLVTLLPACGEVSYKRGGSQQDIDRAHQACRGTGEQLAACLAEQGWQKPKLATDPLFATIESRDNHQEGISKPSPFIEIVPDKKENTTPSVAAKTSTGNAEATSKKIRPELATVAIVEEKPVAPAPHSTINDGPNVEYVINSWWKMGAFPQQLKQDQTACEKKLGQDYLPDYKIRTYKRAFVTCMHDAGWLAIRDIK